MGRPLYNQNVPYMKFAITIVSVILVSFLLVSSSRFLPAVEITLSNHSFVNGLLKYQLFALSIALILLGITVQVSPESKLLLRVGDLNNLAIKEKWLGINGRSSWKSNAIQLALVISIATGIFMYISVKHSNNLSNFSWSFIPMVLLLAFTNSFSEEIIYRVAVNGNLQKLAAPITIFICSAILFGIPHYGGFPNGITGVFMAGVLGYILSKATHETQGIGIAWVIHFLQDVIIFTGLFMMNTSPLN